MSQSRHCRYCEQTHKPRFLCDPAKRILDALYARGQEFNMPTVEFPDPLPAAQVGMGLNGEDSLLTQFVTHAGTVPVAGVVKPLLMFTGRDVYGRALPRWMYAGDDDQIHAVVDLVARMAEMAVRRAAQARGH